MFGSQVSAKGGQKVAATALDIAAGMVSRADAARDARNYEAAALLYDEALRIIPSEDAGIQIQCGHMLKEGGRFVDAERHYAEAARLTPGDPDLALQLGHFYKVTGQVAQAEGAYRKALTLKPDWAEPQRELDALAKGGWRGGGSVPPAPTPPAAGDGRAKGESWHLGDEAARLAHAGDVETLALEVAPRRADTLYRSYGEHIDMRRCGLWERSFWGMMRTLRGVQAVRGFCISLVPIVELQLTFNGVLVHRGPLRGGYALEGEREASELRKYVFNAWLDFGGFAYGRYGMEARFIDANGNARTYREDMVIRRAPRRRRRSGIGHLRDPGGPGERQHRGADRRPSQHGARGEARPFRATDPLHPRAARRPARRHGLLGAGDPAAAHPLSRRAARRPAVARQPRAGRHARPV